MTAIDAAGNTINSYTGTVHFTSSDSLATLPADSTLTSGIGVFSATLITAGTQTITATDTSNSTILGNSQPITVSAAAANHFTVGAPYNATAGTAFNFTVTVQDQFYNTVTGYTGTIRFSGSDPSAVLPTNSTLTNGVGIFTAALSTSGAQTLTATDAAVNTVTGRTPPIDVSGKATHFVLGVPATSAAGNALLIAVTAEDSADITDTSFNGTIHFSSSDVQAGLPADATLTDGVGFFAAILKTAGPQTITATDVASSALTGTSAAITVTALAAQHFAVSAPANAVTGTPISITVTAQDAYNNTVPGYTGTVHISGTDASATLPSNATLTNGLGTFNVTLKSPGNQSITAADTAIASLTGATNTIIVRGLIVTNLTATPSGFVATFDKPFLASEINLYDSTSGGGIDDVLLTGPNAPQVSFHGSLIISPNDQTITFVKTSNFTGAGFNPGTGVLSAGTYTVTFRSATNGFVDSLNGPLDGANNGNPAGSNYTATFVVTTPPVIVAIPAFARGPDSVDKINLPNSATTGIPLNVSVATGITSGKFTLQYNSALLSITAAFANASLSGASLSLDAASTPGTAILDFSSPTALTQTAFLRLGGLTATVPATANSLYRSKSLLHWSGVTLNGGTVAAEGADSVEVVAYFGDASGSANGSFSAGDGSDIAAVATGISTNATLGTLAGFSAFPLADPVILGDLNNDGVVAASAVTLLNSVLAGTPRSQIPTIPANLPITAYGPDPVLSVPASLATLPGDTEVVPVNVDTADPVGSTGATEAVLALRYDPQMFTVSAADVRLGSLTSGWQLTTEVNVQTGEIGIDLFSSTPIQTPAAGSLVEITMQKVGSAFGGGGEGAVGSNAGPAIYLVNQVDPTGQRVFTTGVADGQGAFVVHFSSGQWAVGGGQWAVDDVVLNAENNAPEIPFAAHHPLPTADHSDAGSDAFEIQFFDQYPLPTVDQSDYHNVFSMQLSGDSTLPTADYSEGMLWSADCPLATAHCFEDDYLASLRQSVKHAAVSPGICWPDDLDEG